MLCPVLYYSTTKRNIGMWRSFSIHRLSLLPLHCLVFFSFFSRVKNLDCGKAWCISEKKRETNWYNGAFVVAKFTARERERERDREERAERERERWLTSNDLFFLLLTTRFAFSQRRLFPHAHSPIMRMSRRRKI